MYPNSGVMKEKPVKTDFEINCPICGRMNHYHASRDGELYCKECTELLVWFQYQRSGIELKKVSESAIQH